MQPALLGVRHEQLLHRARRAHVAKPALFLETLRVIQRTLMREQAVFQAAEEHHRELESLGRVQRHHLDAVFPGFGLAFAGFQHRVREERVQRRQRFIVGVRAIRLEAARGRHEFVQVLDARFAAIRLLFLVVLDEPRVVDHVIDLLVQLEAGDVAAQLLDQLQEAVHRRFGLRPQRAVRHAMRRGVPQRDVRRLRLLAHHVERLARRCRASADSRRARTTHRRHGS